MESLKKRIGAEILLLVTAIVWGGGFVVAKAAFDTITPLFVIAFRFTIAAVAVSVIFFKHFRSMNAGLVKSGILLGIYIFLGFVFQTIGLRLTSTSKNAFLASAHVVIVPFLFWLVYKKRPKLKNIIAAVIAMTGIGLLSLNRDFTVNIGDALSLMCSIFFACHFVAVSSMSQKYSPIDLTIIQLITDAVLACITAFAFERFPSRLGVADVGGMVFLGLACTFLAYLFQNIGQKYTSPSRASLILSLESPMASLLSVWLLSEQLTLKTIVGCAVMFMAVLLSEVSLPSIRKKGNRKGCNRTC